MVPAFGKRRVEYQGNRRIDKLSGAVYIPCYWMVVQGRQNTFFREKWSVVCRLKSDCHRDVFLNKRIQNFFEPHRHNRHIDLSEK